MRSIHEDVRELLAISQSPSQEKPLCRSDFILRRPVLGFRELLLELSQPFRGTFEVVLAGLGDGEELPRQTIADRGFDRRPMQSPSRFPQGIREVRESLCLTSVLTHRRELSQINDRKRSPGTACGPSRIVQPAARTSKSSRT
jgi:hypothetical protein